MTTKTIDLTPEARERVERIVTGAFDLGHSITVEDLRGIIATELTAVRAALVAEIVAGVENLGRRPVVLGEPYDNGTDDGWNDATHEVLTLIRATAQETDNGKL